MIGLALIAALLAPAPGDDDPQTVQQAIADGYTPRPPDQPAGSLLGGLLALGPGLLVHGVGHYYVGERDSALALFLAEVMGIALVVGGELIESETNNAGELGGTSNAMTHAGVGLFVGSWAADVVGTFKGAEAFDRDSSRLEGGRFGIAYRFTSDNLTPFRHHIIGRAEADFGFLYVRPMVDIEADLGSRSGHLDLGGRVFRGKNKYNEVVVGSRITRLELSDYGTAAWTLQGYAGFKVDLGQLFRSLRNFYLVNRSGYGWQAWQIEPTTDDTPSLFQNIDFTDSHLLLETGFEVNTGRKTHLTVLYIQDPTRDVRPFDRGGGLVETELVHRYSDELDIEFAVTVGGAWALWLGLGYAL